MARSRSSWACKTVDIRRAVAAGPRAGFRDLIWAPRGIGRRRAHAAASSARSRGTRAARRTSARPRRLWSRPPGRSRGCGAAGRREFPPPDPDDQHARAVGRRLGDPVRSRGRPEHYHRIAHLIGALRLSESVSLKPGACQLSRPSPLRHPGPGGVRAGAPIAPVARHRHRSRSPTVISSVASARSSNPFVISTRTSTLSADGNWLTSTSVSGVARPTATVCQWESGPGRACTV